MLIKLSTISQPRKKPKDKENGCTEISFIAIEIRD